MALKSAVNKEKSYEEWLQVDNIVDIFDKYKTQWHLGKVLSVTNTSVQVMYLDTNTECDININDVINMLKPVNTHTAKHKQLNMIKIKSAALRRHPPLLYYSPQDNKKHILLIDLSGKVMGYNIMKDSVSLITTAPIQKNAVYAKVINNKNELCLVHFGKNVWFHFLQFDIFNFENNKWTSKMLVTQIIVQHGWRVNYIHVWNIGNTYEILLEYHGSKFDLYHLQCNIENVECQTYKVSICLGFSSVNLYDNNTLITTPHSNCLDIGLHHFYFDTHSWKHNVIPIKEMEIKHVVMAFQNELMFVMNDTEICVFDFKHRKWYESDKVLPITENGYIVNCNDNCLYYICKSRMRYNCVQMMIDLLDIIPKELIFNYKNSVDTIIVRGFINKMKLNKIFPGELVKLIVEYYPTFLYVTTPNDNLCVD